MSIDPSVDGSRGRMSRVRVRLGVRLARFSDSIDPWILRPLDPSTFGSIDAWIYQTLDLSMLGSIDPWSYRCLDLSTLGSIDAWIYRCLDLSTLGSIDPLIHRRHRPDVTNGHCVVSYRKLACLFSSNTRHCPTVCLFP